MSRQHRTGVVCVAGLSLAVLAAGCAVGLLGLSGWFIASSALAGATASSAFSYLAPSAGVRAFAVGRIASNYANRVVLHAAALRRVTDARLAFYDRAAAAPDTHGVWSGQSLDRMMADADTKGMAVIEATSPVVVAASVTVGGCLVLLLTGYPLAAVILAVAVAGCATLALAVVRHGDDVNVTRGITRTELVSAVEAWPEMASLGAADHLAERTLHRLATFEANRSRNALTRALATGLARALAAAAVAGVVVAASRGGADVAMLVLIALLAAGVVASAERLVSAADAARASRRADARLNAVASHHPARHSGGPAFFAAYTDDGLRVAGYWLTETPLRAGRSLDFAVAPGETLVVTGASGGGKTTLLDVIETALRQPVTGPSPGRLTAVLADDYVFTGTVASNLRLANPALTHDDIKGLLADMVLDRNGLEPTTAVGVGGRGLSGGEQRRLHIARAVATKPDVLLVDEPTTGLDGTTATHVLAALRRRLPHAVVVLTMHEPPADRGVLDRAVSTLSLD